MTNFKDVVEVLIGLIALLVPLVFALTFIVIVWGVINGWIINVGDEGAIKKGKDIAVAGVIGLVFMFGIWGILSILQSSIF